MSDIVAQLETVKRPRLLLRTARLGAETYNRKRHLPKLLGYDCREPAAFVIKELMQLEQEANEKRRTNDASYSMHFHIEVLIALMCEARDLRASLDQAA